MRSTSKTSTQNSSTLEGKSKNNRRANHKSKMIGNTLISIKISSKRIRESKGES